ncbi:MAG: ABC-2 transporter permease [Lachnospiraceae bacterium]|nr:ABC-2 transporter permease [Lachnospiraceae bacterium]
MKGMLVKDIRLMLQQKRFFIMLFIIAIVMTYSLEDESFVAGWLTVVCSIFAINTIGYDEFDNGYPFLMTLPMERKTYIRGKYLFGALLGVGAWLAYMAVSWVVLLVKGESDIMDILLSDGADNIIYISIFLFLMAVTIPFHIKYGSEKGRLIMLGEVGAVILLGYLGMELLGGMADVPGEPALLEKAVVNIERLSFSLSEWELGGVMIVAATASVVISCCISSAVMKRKEF